MTQRITITVPDDLHRDLQELGSSFNISGVCQEALRSKVSQVRVDNALLRRAKEEQRAMKIYVASRASVAERPAMWRRLRKELGLLVTSTWIDEAGPGETADMGELWARIVDEVLSADLLVLYLEPSDLPLKGAYVEVGIALGAGTAVRVCCPGMAEADRRSQIGSWTTHPAVSFWDRVEEALAVPVSDEVAAGGPS